MIHITDKQKARFYERLVSSEIGCMEWPGAKTYAGYGIVRVGSRSSGTYRTVLAHRMAYLLRHGDISDGAIVCHKCDNPKCCNPDHLFLGTHKDNMDDMDKKGRRVVVHVPGELNPNSRITTEDVTAIRNSDLSCRKLAEQFDISKTQVSRIKRNLAWSNAA